MVSHLDATRRAGLRAIALALALAACADSHPAAVDATGTDAPPAGECGRLERCCGSAIPEYQPYCRSTASGADEARCALLAADCGYCPCP